MKKNRIIQLQHVQRIPTVQAAIDAAIKQAKTEKATVEFNFNGRTIRVNKNSNPDLLLRDYKRPGKRIVGPTAVTTLSEKDMARDALKCAQADHRRAIYNIKSTRAALKTAQAAYCSLRIASST